MPCQWQRGDASPRLGRTLRLSDRYGLTPYDAAYLELAQRRRLPLATLDERLAEAAAAADVEVWPLD